MANPIAALTTIIDTATNLTDLETALSDFLALPHTDQFAPESAHYSVRLDIEEDGCDPETYEPEYTERLHVLLASDDNGDHGGEFRMGEDINSEMICWYAAHASSPVWDAATIAAEIASMVAGLIEACQNCDDSSGAIWLAESGPFPCPECNHPGFPVLPEGYTAYS